MSLLGIVARDLHSRRTRQRAMPLGALALIIVLWHAASGGNVEYADWRFWVDATAPLALAAMAQTIVLLSGGQGLAAGSTAIFVSGLVADLAGEGTASLAVWVVAGPLIGALLGLLNGALIGYARLPSTPVTLATGFAVQGLTLLLILGGPPPVPAIFTTMLANGDLFGFLPSSAVIVAAAGLAWFGLSRTRFHRGLRLLARHETAAERAGLDVRRIRALCYVLAGAGYGLTGVLLAAQVGTADPLAGGPLLLQIYAAVILGGTLPRLCQGAAFGSVIGAFILTGTVNVALACGASLAWSSATDALWLLGGAAFLLLPTPAGRPALRWPSTLRIAPAPHTKIAMAWTATVSVALIGGWALPGAGYSAAEADNLLLVALIMAIPALAQGAVMLAGGIDLSMPGIIAASGLAFVGILQGSDAMLPAAFAVVLAAGTAIGLLNGVGIGRLGVPPALMTLGASGLVAGLGALAIVSLPTGFASPSVTWLMNGKLLGLTPAIWLLGPVVVGLAAWLERLRIGDAARRLAERGALQIRDRRLLLLVYGLAGFLAAAAGALLAGYGGGMARMGQADVYLLPTLLAVSLAGINIGAPLHRPLNILGGVAAVTAFDTLLVRLDLSFPARLSILALVLLAATGLAGWRRRPSGDQAA